MQEVTVVPDHDQAEVVNLDVERLRVRVRELDAIEITEHHAVTAATDKRVELGLELLKLRKTWPRSGPAAKGWGELLTHVGLKQQRAHDLMKLAEDFTAGRETGKGAKPNRDGWCTADWLTALLPKVDLDPCSNPFSSVRAKRTYSLEAGENGLLLPWKGSIYVNGPYSELEPWAAKLEAERKAITAAGFLVNADNSPAWWHMLVKHLRLRLDFDERIEFKPPPGVDPSKNDRPQTLLMDAAFWKKCDRKALLARGTLWERK